MNWVLKTITLSSFLSFRRFHMRCLESGSNPAVGSSSSKTWTVENTIESFVPLGQDYSKKKKNIEVSKYWHLCLKVFLNLSNLLNIIDSASSIWFHEWFLITLPEGLLKWQSQKSVSFFVHHLNSEQECLEYFPFLSPAKLAVPNKIKNI